MNTVTRALLPRAGNEQPAGRPPADPAVDRAWQREMEKAQTQQWFHGFAQPGAAARADATALASGAPDSGARSDERGARGNAFGAIRSAAAPVQVAAGAAPAAASPLPGAPAFATLGPVLSSLGAGSGVPAPTALAWRSGGQAAVVTGVASAEPGVVASAPQEPSPSPAAETSPAQAVRVHVEETAAGLRVWFGIDGDPASVAGRAQALVTELRREAAGNGQRLALVVCNGDTVFADESSSPIQPHQEP